jgi:Tfp pilus assembly protein PilO
MKALGNKLIANIHYIILFYAIYGFYTSYDEHLLKVEGIRAELPSLQVEIQKNKKKVAEIDEFKKKTEEYKARVETAAKNIEAVQKQLPSDISDSSILQIFNNEFGFLNIKDPSITPGQEVESTYFISKDYSLKAKGTFLQFLIFFERLDNAARIFNIKSIKLVNHDSGQKGRFQMIGGEAVIQAFRFNPKFKVERGFEQTDTPVAE